MSNKLKGLGIILAVLIAVLVFVVLCVEKIPRGCVGCRGNLAHLRNSDRE